MVNWKEGLYTMFSGSGKMELVRQVRLGSPPSPGKNLPSNNHSPSHSPSGTFRKIESNDDSNLRDGSMIASRPNSPSRIGSPSMMSSRSNSPSRIGSPSVFRGSSSSKSHNFQFIADRPASPPRTLGNSNYNSNNTVISSTINVTKLLNSDGIDGIVVRRMLESTVRIRLEKDVIHLQYFKSKDLDYTSFRSKLFDLFELVFNDEEFRYVTSLFDEYDTAQIDGFLFMIFYTKLSTVRKDRESSKIRAKDGNKIKQKEAGDERKKLEKEKKSVVSAEYDFSDETRDLALRKLTFAAKQYNPTDTLSLQSNLDGYVGAVFDAGKCLKICLVKMNINV